PSTPSGPSSSGSRAGAPFHSPPTPSSTGTRSGCGGSSVRRTGATWCAPSAAGRRPPLGPWAGISPRSCSAAARAPCWMPTPELARVSEHRQRLAGVRVLVPRPRERSEQICFLLEDEGADVLAVPLLELEPPTDPRPLRAAAELLRRFGWVAFASERG